MDHIPDLQRIGRAVVEKKVKKGNFERFLVAQYHQFSQHSDAYPLFASSIEETIQRDVDVYITEVVKEAKEGKERKEEHTETAEHPGE